METLERAVECALNNTDQSTKQQAIQYCESVKTSEEGWVSCLSLFVKSPQWYAEIIDNLRASPSVRF